MFSFFLTQFYLMSSIALLDPLPNAIGGKGLGTLHTTTCAVHQHYGENCWYSLIVVGVSRCFAKTLTSYNLQRVLLRASCITISSLCS